MYLFIGLILGLAAGGGAVYANYLSKEKKANLPWLTLSRNPKSWSKTPLPRSRIF
jgi:hypothetical protein